MPTLTLTGLLRTVVPVFWGAFVGWLLGHVPALEPLRELLLAQADFLVIVTGAVLLGAWYALTAWLQPRLPLWLQRVLMGSAKAPTYYPPTSDEDTDQTTPEQRTPIPGTTLDRVDGPDHHAE